MLIVLFGNKNHSFSCLKLIVSLKNYITFFLRYVSTQGNSVSMDGFQLVEELNRLPFAEKGMFKISALSSSDDQRDMELMQKLGVRNYIVKPLDFTKVKELIFKK